MIKKIIIYVLLGLSMSGFAQNIIQLPCKNSDKITWEPEKEYFSNLWQTQVVTNVSAPTMQVFKPAYNTQNGTAVIIAPGGGLYALSINSEGNDVAEWLVKHGITAFVLKYRLVPTQQDGVAEFSDLFEKNPSQVYKNVKIVMPLAIKDGLNAVSYVRRNASDFGIDPEKIGFMGFSAGGAVTMGVAYNYSDENKPNFVVPVYAWTTAITVTKPKTDAPPILIICANDDPLGLASGSIDIYNSWHSLGLNAGLFMYSKGGHGFGMRKQGLPSDSWIQRFYDWSVSEGLTTPKEK